MKNWKKNIGFAVVLVVLAGFASSCSNNSKTSDDDDYTEVTQSTIDTSKFVGHWVLTTMVKQDGTAVSPRPTMTVDFTTTTYTQVLDGTTTNGNYFATATKVTLRPTGDDPSTSPYRMTTSNTKIVIEVPDGSGGTNITEYTKQ